MSSTSSTSVLFSSLMQLVNGAWFLNTTFLFLLSGAAGATAVFITDVVPFGSMYGSL